MPVSVQSSCFLDDPPGYTQLRFDAWQESITYFLRRVAEFCPHVEPITSTICTRAFAPVYLSAIQYSVQLYIGIHTSSPPRCAVGGRRGLTPTPRLTPRTRVAFHGQTAREQWLAAEEATHVAKLVSFLCGHFRSAKKCNFRPIRPQQYPGMLCELDTTTFQFPQNELDTLRQLLQAARHAGCLSFRTLLHLASKHMSMTVAIRPVSLCTHAMFAVLADLEKSSLRIVDPTRDLRADMLGRIQAVAEFLSAASPEGPWQRAQHFAAVSTQGSSDASSVAWVVS